MNDPAQHVATGDGSGLSGWEGHRGVLGQALVRPGGVVVLHIFDQDAPQMALPENEQMVEAFLPYGTDPALRERVGFGSMEGRQHNLHALGLEDLIKARREFGIAVVNEEPHGLWAFAQL